MSYIDKNAALLALKITVLITLWLSGLLLVGHYMVENSPTSISSVVTPMLSSPITSMLLFLWVMFIGSAVGYFYLKNIGNQENK